MCISIGRCAKYFTGIILFKYYNDYEISTINRIKTEMQRAPYTLPQQAADLGFEFQFVWLQQPCPDQCDVICANTSALLQDPLLWRLDLQPHWLQAWSQDRLRQTGDRNWHVSKREIYKPSHGPPCSVTLSLSLAVSPHSAVRTAWVSGDGDTEQCPQTVVYMQLSVHCYMPLRSPRFFFFNSFIGV